MARPGVCSNNTNRKYENKTQTKTHTSTNKKRKYAENLVPPLKYEELARPIARPGVCSDNTNTNRKYEKKHKTKEKQNTQKRENMQKNYWPGQVCDQTTQIGNMRKKTRQKKNKTHKKEKICRKIIGQARCVLKQHK